MDEQSDYYDVLRINQNWTKLDALLGDLGEKVRKNIEVYSKYIEPIVEEITLITDKWKDEYGIYTYTITSDKFCSGNIENKIELLPALIDSDDGSQVDNVNYAILLQQLNIVGAIQKMNTITILSTRKPYYDVNILLYIYEAEKIENEEGGSDENVSKEIASILKQINDIKVDLESNYLSRDDITNVVNRYDEIKEKV